MSARNEPGAYPTGSHVPAGLPRRATCVAYVLLLVLAVATVLARAEGDYEGGKFFERVVEVLRKSLPDDAERLGSLAAEYIEKARATSSEAEERDVVFSMLSEIPSSHVGLLSRHAHAFAEAELGGRDTLTLGLVLVGLDDGFFVSRVMHGGPAHEAGIRRGDRVVAIDGIEVARSPRLDYRSDDAYLDDPPTHLILVDSDDPVTLSVLETRDQEQPAGVVVEPRLYGSSRADRAAIRVIEQGGHAIGYVPFSLMYFRDLSVDLHDAFAGPLEDCEAFVLDARGRGGSARAVWRILGMLRAGEDLGGRPIVLLVDGRTRSAKELLAYGFRRMGIGPIVGEHTAGAVRACRFVSVADDTFLLCPIVGKGKFPGELTGVPPDVEQADRLPYAHGADPILDAGLARVLKDLAARKVPSDAASSDD